MKLPEIIIELEESFIADYQDPPEKALRKAMLDRALLDYLNVSGAIPWHVQKSAEVWMFSNAKKARTKEVREWPCNFVNVCEDLSLDVKRIREYAKTERSRVLDAKKNGEGYIPSPLLSEFSASTIARNQKDPPGTPHRLNPRRTYRFRQAQQKGPLLPQL